MKIQCRVAATIQKIQKFVRVSPKEFKDFRFGSNGVNPSENTARFASSGEEFDFVIVGAGSAGATLATRLSEDPAVSGLLLEAGKAGRKPEVHIPAAFSALFRSEIDWDYNTVAQPSLENRSIYWPRGKMLGGSSSINAMMWVRGFASDYQSWGAAAGSAWSWQSLLPYFRRIENIEDSTNPDHGSSGPMIVEAQRSPRSHTETFLEAAQEIGFSLAPHNTDAPEGFNKTMVNQHHGSRFSVADAYLKPAKNRANLSIRTQCHATKVIIEGQRATGVEYYDGGLKTVRARREVILSGGTINAPQLLMLSGIGPAAELKTHGIESIVDAPEVGKNLYDHLLS